MVTDDDKLLIERLLEGSLPGNDHRILRARLEKDAALSEYVRQQEEMQSFISREARVTAALEHLNGLDRQATTLDSEPAAGGVDSERPTAPAASSKYRIVPGILILIALLALLFYFLNRTAASEVIIEHRPLAVAMSDAPPAEVSTFNAGNYAEALPLLIAAETTRPNPEYQLAIAVSYLETDRPEAAVPYLEKLTDAPLYGDARNFYTALALWQSGRAAEAREALDRLPADSFYAPAAGRLRIRMND